MLTSLSIENFAIVSKLELDFQTGMTAFTGETGAGKSIMIDALMLALGGRADASVVRPGCDKCDINACFDYDIGSKPTSWLQEHDVADDSSTIILRRVIYAEGRSKSYINGQPFPLHKLKELSEMLVDIHGQHQHQSLLQHPTHRTQLDQFAGHQALVDEVADAYRACKKIKKQLDAITSQGTSDERQALLNFQIEELSLLDVKEDEMQSLSDEHQMLHHAREYIEQSQHISDLLNGETDQNITHGLSQITQWLSQLPQDNPQIKNTAELINSALIQCEEAADEMETFSGKVQLDPERLQEVEERMGLLHQAARKYHVDANQLLDHLRALEEEREVFSSRANDLEQIQQAYEEQLELYRSKSNVLHDSRKKHATKLAEAISKTIKKLGMPNGYIDIEMTPLETMQQHGLDKVEYKVCTNPGMKPDTLNKIASGGELSRISLAIQMITAQRGSTPTLLFDEVDVGIGGATAALVGQLLRNLGERLQIFCVTHQPQVAASAHHHFVVEKNTDKQHTYSSVKPLIQETKVDEIARMLGGLKVTDQTRSHAKELLAQA
jgi:DNA repair protein RecN (Recombination protein N)